jgi:hypothetical protein
VNSGTFLTQEGSVLRIEVDDWTNDGTVRLEGGAVELAGTSFTNSVTGVIEGNGTLDASTTSFANHGTIAPGLSTGIMRIEGDYLQTETGSLSIEIAGTTSSGIDDSEFDQLQVAGNAAIGGDLAVMVLPGFFPKPEDVFPVLTAQNIVGTFSNALSSIDLGYGSFDVFYTDTEVFLANFQPTIPLLGDFNLDGLVDGDDFLLWQRGGSPNPFSSTDLADWEENYGSSWQATISGEFSVPEPSAITLLLVFLSLASQARFLATVGGAAVEAR